MLNTLKELCLLDGVSGNERPVREYILAKLDGINYIDQIKTDALGNLLVHLKGKQPAAKTLMIAAHMDEVGVIATGVTSDGFVRFATVGGIDKAVLFGHRVRFGEHIGVIGGKAIHMCKGDEKDEIPSGDLLIDIGASSEEEALNMISVGDTAVFDSDFYALGQLVKGRAIDDRAGCAVMLEIANTQPETDVWLAFTVQEEVGLHGAKTAAYAIEPDVAIVIDATTAADVVGVPREKQVCRVYEGAVVSFMDRRTLYDKDLYDTIMRTAAENGIKAQPKSMVAGGNDAGAIQTAKGGVKVSAISLPCRYIHSPSCVASMDDLQAIYALVSTLIGRLAV